MAFNIAAIRRMLENAGLFSGSGCPHCRFPVPPGAEICGHCGRELTRADAP
jgi:predicted amidophosphoribosyltransferase